MQLITFTEAIPHEGYAEGQTVSVDEMSAKALISAGKAVAYESPVADGEVEYVETIDDIVDPGVAAKRSQINSTIVSGVDPGPRVAVTDSPAEAEVVDGDGETHTGELPTDASGKGADEAKAKATAPKPGSTTTPSANAPAAPGPNPAGAVAGGPASN